MEYYQGYILQVTHYLAALRIATWLFGLDKMPLITDTVTVTVAVK
jgi:hypothetical protein